MTSVQATAGHSGWLYRFRKASMMGAVVSLALVSSGAAMAAEGCDALPDLATADAMTTALVRQGVAKSYFYKGPPTFKAAACPAFSDACRDTAYVVAGDRVIVSGSTGDFLCAHFVAPRKRGDKTYQEIVRSGWLTGADLAPEPPPKPVAWTGAWSRVEATIAISAGSAPGTLNIKGDATFGAMDPDRVKRGAVNMGEISGVVTPKDSALSFAMGDKGAIPIASADKSDCKVWMRRVGPWLLVDDNQQCGGMNVSFRGLYAK